MFSSLSRIDLSWPRAARAALKVLMLAGISAGWAAEAHAQVDVKKAIVLNPGEMLPLRVGKKKFLRVVGV